MPRYLIEVRHNDDHAECVRALRTIKNYGGHFLTHADWGCKDGVHRCWLIVDLDRREEAQQLVAPEYRASTLVVELNRFTPEQVDALTEKYDPQS